MRINQDNVINYSPDASFLLIQEEDAFSRLEEGDIITGTVIQNGSSPMIRFDEISKEIPADPELYRYSAIGEKHAFRVEKSGSKVSLKDLGALKNNDAVNNIAITDPRDSSLLRLTRDFRETMNDIESEETKAASDMSEDDAVRIIDEGFDLEDFKAERLVRALERIHEGRTEKTDDIEDQISNLREDKKMIKKQSARTAADRYGSTLRMADRLFGESVSPSNAYTTHVSNTSPEPAVSGTTPLGPETGVAYTAARISAEKNADTPFSYTPPLNPAATGTTEIVPDVGTVTEGIAISPEIISTDITPEISAKTTGTDRAVDITPKNGPAGNNSETTKSSLADTNTDNSPESSPITESAETSGSAARETDGNKTSRDAIYEGSSIQAAVQNNMNASELSTWREITFRISIEETRLRMAGISGKTAENLGTTFDFASVQNTINNLRERLRSFMEDLSREWDIDTGTTNLFFSYEETSRIATDTLITAAEIADAPVSFYRSAISVGTSITFEALGATAADEQISASPSVVTMSVIASYDASTTEVRADLGDSIKKAFDHIDEVLTENNLPVTDANKRAVRILASAGMDVTAGSIEEVKYYDAKVMDVVNRMTPAAVLSLIKRGINPLKESIDSLENLLDEAPEKSPLSREEQISSFLVNLDEKGDISEAERTAYINIYRLLYTISRDDYAAIASVLADGRDMTLKNLLTAQRSRRVSGMDVKIDDSTSVVHNDLVNSISANLEAAFAYNKRLTNEILSEDDPEVTDRALKDSVPDDRYEELTLEEVAFRLREAKEDNGTGPARARELVRFCMSSSPEYRRFLKKLGLKDSVKNTMALIDGLNGDNLGIPAGNSASLTTAMESKETLDAYASQHLSDAENNVKDMLFPDEQTNTQSPDGVLSALSRYDLLRDMTKKEHYRFTLENGSGSSINLTFIHDRANAGTVSIHIADEMVVTTASLTVRNTPKGSEGARAFIYGSISCESTEETIGAEKLLEIYRDRMAGRGIDASGITVHSAGLGILQQLSDLTGIIPPSYTPPEGSEASSGTLYEAARTFVEIWTSPY
ncbi:MAG: DUF6240 domain-containing protein [Lachnospiraceae bacterium]|nr:DUF6240 domain-containing protein [Lachnospiraceae bacterium]